MKRNDDKILTLDKRIFASSTLKENLYPWRFLQTKEMLDIGKVIYILKGKMITLFLEKVGLMSCSLLESHHYHWCSGDAGEQSVVWDLGNY